MSKKALPVLTAGSVSNQSAIIVDLITELSSLACPEDEDCSLFVKEGNVGITVFLRRQKLVSTENRWIRDHDPQEPEYPYIYAALFETESPPEIVDAIKRILEMTAIV